MNEKEQIIFHIDVNSAYLSWTAVKMMQEGYGRDLREIPCIVGGQEKQARYCFGKIYFGKEIWCSNRRAGSKCA